MSDVGYMSHFYALSTQVAWMTLQRHSPITTSDGGTTWQETSHALDDVVGDWGQNRRLTWVDPLHLWYYSYTWLFRSEDGGASWVMQRQYGDSN